MNDFMLAVPDEVYHRARQIAHDTAKPIEQILIDHLKTLAPVLPVLAPDEEAELEALHHLSDDALWTIAAEQMPDDLQARMQILMDKNSRGTINPDEYSELESLVERGQRLMLRKSEAAAILTQRGYKVRPQDMAGRG
jgi:hypothetical protein